MACNMSLSDVVKCQNIPTLADVNRVYGNTVSMAIISEHLKSVFRYSGLDMSEGKLQSDTLLRDQLGETSFAILKGYYFLNLAELCIFFNELKAGRRGQFLWGSRINNQAIMVALHDFTLDRNKAITKLESERLNAENLKGCSTIKGMGAAFVKGINSIEELRKKAKSDFKAFRTLFPNLPSNYKENDLFLAYGGKEAAIQAIFGEDIPASEASEAIFRYLCDYNILRFGLSSYMSINRETPIRYVENDMPDLEKSIKLNFIELRTKQS